MTQQVNEMLEATPKPDTVEVEEWLAIMLHVWYLEACQQPESQKQFNPKVQVSYEDLPEGSKSLSRYIAGKVNEMIEQRLLSERSKAEEERAALLGNILEQKIPGSHNPYSDERYFNDAVDTVYKAVVLDHNINLD